MFPCYQTPGRNQLFPGVSVDWVVIINWCAMRLDGNGMDRKFDL